MAEPGTEPAPWQVDVNETPGLCRFTPGEVRGLILRDEVFDGLSLTALCGE